jgi:nicotinate-nucleotide adenylyltransferase
MPKIIAILGGTFDPIHNGHILSAIHVAKWLDVSQVNLIPAHLPPHKNTVNASPQQRADMVKLVCDSEPLFVYDQRELKRKALSYTVDTLKEIKKESPQTTLFFIIGMDSLLSFTRWHRWQEILTLCHLVVNCRPNYSFDNLPVTTQSLLKNHQLSKSVPPQLINKQAGYILFPPEIFCDVSSTLIRSKIKKKQSFDNLMPTSVLNYINEHQLYR